ncbi:MAG: hypothetical protein DSY80_08585 [Desulfocapsa sp.]|nr:MAG: hypothetical protein DSY80_08585 [Desulfocapsa sp.]
MKYLLTIFALVVMSSMLTLYYLWPDTSVEQTVAIPPKASSYHQPGADARLAASVTRQILVQEAQRIGIDKEDSFRKSLKEYYEQSLVRVLTDRKLAELEVTVTEEDIDRYLSRFGKIYTFTRIPVEGGKVQEENGHQSTVLFDELSVTLRLLIAELKPGESAKQFETGTEISVIRLDKIVPADVVPETGKVDRIRVREQLENYQRSLEIDRWINALQKKYDTQKSESH